VRLQGLVRVIERGDDLVAFGLGDPAGALADQGLDLGDGKNLALDQGLGQSL
jgi:hypothetical protein